ncbi:cadmium-translocating P-type ATPase [Lysinibacillus sphaericus]|uniref:P-type Cu(+) transporter n=1 Tax=Lysinibacillus sphaericus TaxID=1421 RepID=A0A2S0JW90_LYSSH|nr:heavy metal translocating P-type ATPase [Lysinibacillus sphaericus]AVK95413.1 heavy metal translocating P-type ATPase [Lysinibacillus sphaericus]MCS1383224.1 heavy metal translocating P-type ATPase [Lysinibacillus sphaericus]MED4546308.1 heavy metal translocating P-type ATPase [Lysinibacillus sphaericus]TKI19332.1 cadmium-translocating P-type ATPase [Lysinibacillus sphaericus]UDK98430.1 cadmium-translocating P-type ATPase [Lysinibacillus sphaericus]
MEYSNRENVGLIENIKVHAELIAAIMAGLFILLAWRLDTNDQTTASVLLYIVAFCVGGFAKAKEGIEETIKEKKLNVELLMILAAIGSAAIGYWTEGAILIFIFAVSGALETYAMNKSHREISALMNLQPEEAWLVRGGFEPMKVAVSTLKIGDHLLIKPGERVPADGIIFKGQSSIDESAISGEPLPIAKFEGDEVFAGTVNLNGAITMEMTKPNSETLFQKIIMLVQNAQSEKSPSQQFIEKFEGTYVKLVLLSVALMMFLPHFLIGWDWTTTFYRAMVLLVVASPCALVASIMPATLAAISNGAKNGILFKGGLHLEHLSALRALAVDKTGTLTQGKPVVTDFIVRDGLNQEETLAILAGIEAQSNHPLAQAITTYAKAQHISQFAQATIEDIPGWGMKGFVNGTEYLIGKPDFVGSEEANTFANNALSKLSAEGKTVIFIRDKEGIVALAALKDTVRDEAKKAVALLKELGIDVIMLTGDNEKTAKVIAKEAGVTEYVAECLPETKVTEMKRLLDQHKYVGMVGDGINDAPALATATTGIAMGEGTDVALETADVVLMKNDLSKIAYAVRLSRKMQRIVKQNIFFSIGIIVLLIASNFLQVVDLPLGVIGHEGSTILVILNGLRMLNKNV